MNGKVCTEHLPELQKSLLELDLPMSEVIMGQTGGGRDEGTATPPAAPIHLESNCHGTGHGIFSFPRLNRTGFPVVCSHAVDMPYEVSASKGNCGLSDSLDVRPAQPVVTLESLGNYCRKDAGDIAGDYDPENEIGDWAVDYYELLGCRCKSWFCPDCCKWMGYALRRKVTEVIKTFKSVMMITLTVDRTLFANQEQAYRWVREHRGIGRLIENLRRNDYLRTSKYFYVLEFQKAEWPHWHVLVDSRFVDAGLVSKLWGKLRPQGLPLVEGRPLFGKVDVQAGKFRSKEHAANYATKYLVKTPENGFPQWVLDFEGRVMRYGVSRGFWGPRKKRMVFGGSDGKNSQKHADEKIEVPHPPECFCKKCREGSGKRRNEKRTVGERVEKCGDGTILMRLRIEHTAGEKTAKVRRKYLAQSSESYETISNNLIAANTGGHKRAFFFRGEIKRIIDFFIDSRDETKEHFIRKQFNYVSYQKRFKYEK